jgi:hypothetical protein
MVGRFWYRLTTTTPGERDQHDKRTPTTDEAQFSGNPCIRTTASIWACTPKRGTDSEPRAGSAQDTVTGSNPRTEVRGCPENKVC